MIDLVEIGDYLKADTNYKPLISQFKKVHQILLVFICEDLVDSHTI